MKASEEELKLGRQRPPQGLVSESAALRTTWRRTSVVTTENWSGTCHFRFVIFKKDIFPQMTIIIITCSLKLLDIAQSELRVETVIKSVISVICSDWMRKKSFTIIIAQSLLRLLQNIFQLHFWFHFLEDQAELMHRTQYEMDLEDGRR